ncbi:MAG: hypothetical protein K2Y56_24020 [Methylobacterium sp.]|uniref:hypothetical protein n=1 Tax=Methylobacterium sp. TaxID=409 RepID=UPI0025FE0DEE|nr:hypothetical protein [Methylobacterium sp.]MBX9934545.1 hypothetical protein [Methylobacterium sp.]
MRVSVERTDPGFREALTTIPARERYTVFLDSVAQEAVITADEEAGLVICHERDGDGYWRHQDGEMIRIERRGAVRIERAS